MDSKTPLSDLATLILQDWKSPHFAARPYISALSALRDESDTFGHDSAKEIVLRFLCNASTWRGPVARQVKAELKHRFQLK